MQSEFCCDINSGLDLGFWRGLPAAGMSQKSDPCPVAAGQVTVQHEGSLQQDAARSGPPSSG